MSIRRRVVHETIMRAKRDKRFSKLVKLYCDLRGSTSVEECAELAKKIPKKDFEAFERLSQEVTVDVIVDELESVKTVVARLEHPIKRR
jgi:hypothetical protein